MAAVSTDFTLQLRCGIVPTSSLAPKPRSAHNCVPGPSSSLYLVAGDSGVAGQRFSDTWRLSYGGGSGDSSAYTWTEQQKGCTPRSNAAAAATGDWLLIFGGWSSTGLEPLDQLEAFSFSSNTWFTLPALSGCQGPSPRGQPAAAADTAGSSVWVFGGWDGNRRFNDLYKLLLCGEDPNSWVWQQVTPQHAPPKGARAGVTFQQQQQALQRQLQARQDQQQAARQVATQQQLQKLQQQEEDKEDKEVALPCERADHVMVCWNYCDDGLWKDLLVVFGGSCSEGLLNDTWLFDISTTSWTQAFHGGAGPCPRSSCAAAITGDVLLVHGGQTPAGVLHDLHLLNLSTLTWLQVDLGDVLQPLCRHSMVLQGANCLIFGGYNGSSASNTLLQIDLQPVMQLQRSSLQDLINCMACCGSDSSSALVVPGCCDTDSKHRGSGKSDQLLAGAGAGAGDDDAAAATSTVDAGDANSIKLKAVGVVPKAIVLPVVPPVVKALSKKAAPPPLRLSDLPNADEVAAMPQWKQVRQLHQAAFAAGCDQYIDPKTGYTVFTAKYLQQRQCCGNKCRHCPHGWVNVAKHRLQPASASLNSTATATAAAAVPDW